MMDNEKRGGDDVTITQEAPRRGRPPMQWMTWEDLLRVRSGTAVLIDRGQHEVRTVGRVMGRSSEVVLVRSRDRVVHRVTPATFERARQVPGLFDEGDPVLKVGVSEQDWRGGVIRNGEGDDRGMVLVETLDGVSWEFEGELEHADDRAQSLQVELPRLKPGPPAADPVVEALNQEAFSG